MKSVEMEWHEFTANLLFAKRGLSPFFAVDAAVKDAGGATSWRGFESDGERWQAKLYHQPSNILPPEDDTPAGTSIDLETMREFRLAVRRHPREDETADADHDDPDERGGQQRFNAHIAPRWQGMRVENQQGQVSEYSVPEGIQEAVNARVKGSNIDAFRYRELLAFGMDAVGVPAWNWDRIHEYSNVQDAERYVRIHRHASGPVHSRDGVIAKLGHLLESDRDGYRKLVQNDQDEQNRNLPGYYHTATLGPERVREAWPTHELPVEIKHYYAREALSVSSGHALEHPKLGASYQVSRWDETLRATEDGLTQLQEELDAIVRSVLLDAGIDLAPSSGTGDFVPDAYFDATVSDGHDEPLTLDLTNIQSSQESVVIRHIADGLSPVEWESLQTLVTDGGQVSPQHIADEHERHVDSVYRALGRLDELVEKKYGEVALRSKYVAELVHEKVNAAKQANREAVETAARTISAAERGLDQAGSEFVAWCSRYGVDISNRRDALGIDLGELDPHADADPGFLVRTGMQLWKKARQDPARYRAALVSWTRPDGTTVNRRAFSLL